jgi:selenocysteine lyase/cysteine desulfurase
MNNRVPTFAFNVEGHSPLSVAEHLAERNVAVWDGDYYAVEVMKRLGLDHGAVRAGFVHYNTADEIDRLLAGLSALR